MGTGQGCGSMGHASERKRRGKECAPLGTKEGLIVGRTGWREESV